jgi:predicted TPR repeat methyltransferase
MIDPRFPDATKSMNKSMSLDGNPKRLAKFYDDWAVSYDEDLTEDYSLPATMVRTLTEAIDANDSLEWAISPDIKVLDAGCGTGLVGLALSSAGYLTIDGVDLSAEMVTQAKQRNIYRRLEADFDLTKPVVMRRAASYDLVLVAGVFTVGHVPPSALTNVADLVRPGGLLIVSTRVAYYDSTNYQAVSDGMEAAGQIKLVHKIDNGPYTLDSTAHYWAYRVEK